MTAPAPPAVEIRDLTHRYGGRVALAGVSLDVRPGEVVGLLGPNGSGKSTLFAILSTALPAAPGAVRVFGRDVSTDRDAVRRQIGVVFQAPSIDLHLTARENLLCQAALYGMPGSESRRRADDLLDRVKLADRADDRCKTFSGGMRRRVELAKCLLHRPRLLVMDEPSTGLDPGARLDLWDLIRHTQRTDGTTVLLTTHLMDEADRCDRVAILDAGRVLATDAPAVLKGLVGGDVVTVGTARPDEVRAALRERLGLEAVVIDGAVRLERDRAHELVPRIVEASPPGSIASIAVGRPALEDVFIHLTGRRYRADADADRADDRGAAQPPADPAPTGARSAMRTS